jgi:glycosyltransferase involved in cell wall biosynthesis
MSSVLSGLMFFPRGGSATVARSLALRLGGQGWDVRVVSGSVPGYGDAASYYEGVDVHPVPFAPDGEMPPHPSYEDRDGDDNVFARLDDAAFEEHVAAWAEHLEEAGAADADVLHLHHLTPLHEAAARVAPHVPVVVHLHGTELLMLETIAGGAPDTWVHAEAWADRMREWAGAAATLIVPSSSHLPRVERLLGVARERVTVLSNGVDVELFDRVFVDRAAHWRRHLVDEPHGWRAGSDEGSVNYTLEDAERVAARPVVVYVGRFTSVKRLPLLIEAWAAAQPEASLVLVGGHPGEWEGEHPLDAIERTGARDVYLAGWQPQARLPVFYSAADLLVLPSVAEQFGLVLVESMACGLPPVAVDRFGPRDIVDHGSTGWLVEPDDGPALASAIAEALDHPEERRRRGETAHAAVRARFSWDAAAEQLARVLERAAATVRS